MVYNVQPHYVIGFFIIIQSRILFGFHFTDFVKANIYFW